MKCPVCNRDLAPTLSICLTCGAWIGEAARREALETRIPLEELERVGEIADQELETAPNLPAEVQKEQAATYAGTSDHASIVEQLAEKEEERDSETKRADQLAFDVQQLKFNERFDLHELRREYMPKLFYMVVGWLSFVAGMILITAFGVGSLSDAVLIALITTTTATVVGMFLIAARWLFPSKHK